MSAIYRERETGRPDFEATVPARRPTSRMAGIFDNTAGYSSGIALVNPNSVAIRLGVILRNTNGIALRTAAFNLGPMAHTSFFINQMWPETANVAGRIVIEAVEVATGNEATFVPLGLRFAPGGAFTTLTY